MQVRFRPDMRRVKSLNACRAEQRDRKETKSMPTPVFPKHEDDLTPELMTAVLPDGRWHARALLDVNSKIPFQR
jgi:hypothetical protein